MKKNFLFTFFALLVISTAYPQYYNEVFKAIVDTLNEDDNFGKSVSISGNFAIAGSPYDDEGAEEIDSIADAGSAYIFERDKYGNWTKVQKIVASDRDVEDFFGCTVGISGNYAVVGANWEDEDENGENTLTRSGSAYVFERKSNGEWIEVQKLVANTRGEDERFGTSLSISGNYIISGLPLANGYIGTVYIYERDSLGIWNETDPIPNPDNKMMDAFGTSVSISGDYAIIGATGASETGNTTFSGAAYILERSVDNKWNISQKITASDKFGSDFFGSSVSISGNYAIVGAHYEDKGITTADSVNNAGAVYIFERIGAGSWKEIKKIVAPDRAEDDFFGYSVSVSDSNAMVGSWNDLDNNGENNYDRAGAAYVYERSETGEWSYKQKVVSSLRGTDFFFGYAIALSGDYGIIGSFGEDAVTETNDTLVNSGSAFIIESCAPNSVTDTENIIENGDFENCILVPWEVYLDNENIKANAVITDGKCTISDITTASEPSSWHIQFKQNISELMIDKIEAGSVYTLSFEAYAGTDERPCLVTFQNSQDPWTSLLVETVTLSTSPENYEYDFLMSEIFPVMSVTFQTGDQTSSITFDNISIKKKKGSGLRNNTFNDLQIFPNPVSNYLNIYSEDGSEIKLYNNLGVLVRDGKTADGVYQFDVKELPKGIYLIQITKGIKIANEKIVVK